MAAIRHLKNAPITEAIIDFRATLPPGFEPSVFSGLEPVLAEQYPVVERRNLMEAEFGKAENGRPVFRGPEDKGLHGFWFRSEDGRDIAQFRLDGFTFNRLSPYTSWEEVFEEASRLWHLYEKAATPRLITRVATRYINNLVVPWPVDNLSQYLTTPLPVPSGLPFALNSFLTRIAVHDRQLDVKANVTQALASVVEGEHVTFLLDIDAYHASDKGIPRERLISVFEALRSTKNRIFFDSITEQTVGRYE